MRPLHFHVFRQRPSSQEAEAEHSGDNKNDSAHGCSLIEKRNILPKYQGRVSVQEYFAVFSTDAVYSDCFRCMAAPLRADEEGRAKENPCTGWLLSVR